MGKRNVIMIRVMPVRNRLEEAYVYKTWEKIVATIDYVNNPSNHFLFRENTPMIELSIIRRKLKNIKTDDWDKIDEISKWLGHIEHLYEQKMSRNCALRDTHIRKSHIRKSYRKKDSYCKRMRISNMMIHRNQVALLKIPKKNKLGLFLTSDRLLSNLKLNKNGIQRESIETIK